MAVGKTRPEHPPNKRRKYSVATCAKKMVPRCTAVGRIYVVGLVFFLLRNLNGARLWCYCACACATRREKCLRAMLRVEIRASVESEYRSNPAARRRRAAKIFQICQKIHIRAQNTRTEEAHPHT